MKKLNVKKNTNKPEIPGKGKDGHHINAVALLDLAGNLRLVDGLLRIKFLHCLFSPFH